MKVKTAEKFLKNLKCRETTVLIKYHYAVSCLNPFRDDLALKPVFGYGDLLILVLSDNYVGRPEKDLLYLCWTDGSTDLDVGVLAARSQGRATRVAVAPTNFFLLFGLMEGRIGTTW